MAFTPDVRPENKDSDKRAAPTPPWEQDTGLAKLKHSSGMIANVPVGFSWTTLFFGILVPVWRGWSNYAVGHIIMVFVTGGIWWLVAPFLINGHYARHLICQGFVPAGEEDKKLLAASGVRFE